ncbi:MAG: radical SAM protein [Bdellovibrionota bacterium]
MPSTQPNEKLIGFCSAPWTDCITYADGELKACDRNVASFGNWQKDGLKTTWNSDKFKEFRRAMAEGRYPDQDCASCHNNGTQRTAESSMGGAFHTHVEYLQKFLGMPWIKPAEEFRELLKDKKSSKKSQEAIPAFYEFLQSLKAAHAKAFAEDKEFHLAIVKLNVIAEALEDYLHGSLQPRRVATFRQSQLQAKCTARCVMCAGKFTGEIVDGPTMDEEFVDEAFAEIEDVTDFWCNGAEYLYYKGWKKIALMLAEQGTKLRVSTNGILLTEPTIKFMVDNKILRYLTVSLDAATKETLESTRVNVNFEKCMDRIRYLLAYANEKELEFEFTAAFVMMKRNLEELPAFIRLIHSLRPPGCKTLVTVLCQPLENFDVLNYRRFVHEEHHVLFGEKKLREIFTDTYAAHLETGIQVSFYNQKLKDFMAEGMPFPKYFPRKSDVDIFLVDLVRGDAKSGFLQAPMEKELPILLARAGSDTQKLQLEVLRKAREIISANAVVQEVAQAFPELLPKLENVLPKWVENFCAKVGSLQEAPASSAMKVESIESSQENVRKSEKPLGLVVTSVNESILVQTSAESSQLLPQRLFLLALSHLYISAHRIKNKVIGDRKSLLLWNISVTYRRALGLLGLRISPLPISDRQRRN